MRNYSMLTPRSLSGLPTTLTQGWRCTVHLNPSPQSSKDWKKVLLTGWKTIITHIHFFKTKHEYIFLMQPAKDEHAHTHKEKEETELFVAAVHRVGDCLSDYSDHSCNR